jgi:hypothetical protein
VTFISVGKKGEKDKRKSPNFTGEAVEAQLWGIKSVPL